MNNLRSYKNYSITKASANDALAIANLRNSAALLLTEKYGRGHWSGQVSERSVLAEMRGAMVFAVRTPTDLVATFALSTRKPWAIDTKYFSPCEQPLYLINMAVSPSYQGQGVGQYCMQEARRMALEWPADALRLDAFDAVAGAGPFYRKCGFREVGRASYRGVPHIYYELLLF